MKDPTTYREIVRLIEQAADEGWKELDLSGLGLEVLPSEIGKCKTLEKLLLGKEGQWQWDRNYRKLPKAALIGNCLHTLPTEIQELQKLKVIDLTGNPLNCLPEEIFEISELQCINGTSIGCEEIPEKIHQLRALTSLDLTGNQISIIPDFIFDLKEFKSIFLALNQITCVPHDIRRLTNLTTLSLIGNQISTIPNAVFDLKNLSIIRFSHNQITFISEFIGQLTELEKIHLSHNQIRSIPESIGCLERLAQLNLYNNKITVIPETIYKLSQLTDLSISGNRIKSIPEGITQLTQLVKLQLDRNQIENLPEHLESLPKLQILDLRGNPLPIAPEILGPNDFDQDPGDIARIFNYFHQLHSGEVRPLNEAKVLLIGQADVGKTSLISRLIYNKYNSDEFQTDGLEITNWSINVHTKDVRLNIWDFGGQDIYHATHQFFLTKRSLYLLVANCRDSEEQNRLNYWLQMVESLADSAPVIIIGNKSDEQPLDLDRKALQEKYPNIKAILETSCATGEGIEALRQAITQEVGNLREVYDLLPESWFNVKEQLESMTEDFISQGRYATICTQQTITAEPDQLQLLDLLHKLGIILNFRDHPILQNLNILNPHWVTSGIYALLSDPTLKTQKGILSQASLSRILDPDRYPKNRHHCLTELMREFQLCFEITNGPTATFLIPALLPKEQPGDTELPGDTLAFQYHYPILPDSILSRFIVLSSDKIHNATYWRTGVVLAYRENSEIYNLARITADPADRIITIVINGRESTRRAFLTLIRDTLTKIHNSFANLEVGEFVPVPDHPDAEPLDYQELLGLEEMGDRTVTIGKLKLRLDLRQLLDGYESIEQRQTRRMRDRGDTHYHFYGDIEGDWVARDKAGNDMIRGDKIEGDQRIDGTI
jgi:internalin A